MHTEKHGDDGSITFTYDRANNLKTVNDARGNSTIFKYDANNLRVEQNGASVDTYKLNADGSEVSATSVSPTVTNQYDKVGNLVRVTDANGNKTTYFYDENHHLTGMVTADKALTVYVNDAVGRKTQETVYMVLLTGTIEPGPLPSAPEDTNARVTSYAYDQASRLTLTTYPAEKMSTVIGGATTSPSVYTPDTPVSLTEANLYDARGNLIESTDRTGKKTLHFYDVNGRESATVEVMRNLNFASQAAAIAAQTTPVVLGGYVTLLDRDQQGNITKKRVYGTMLTPSQVTALRTSPRPTTVAAPGGTPDTTNYYYNVASKLLQKVDPAFSALSGSGLATVSVRTRVTYSYDQSGQACKLVTDTVNASDDTVGAAARSGTVSTMYMVHDAQGREVATVSSRGALTRNYYDGNGNQTKAVSYFGVVADPVASLKKQMTQAELDTVASGLSGKDALQDKYTSRWFDVMNRLTAQYDEIDGVEDNAGHLTQGYRYDANGNRTRLEDENGNVTKTGYDIRDRVSQVEANGSVSVAEYDATGKATLMYLGQTRVAVPAPTVATSAALTGNQLKLTWNTTGGARSRVLYSWTTFGYPVGVRVFGEAPVLSSALQLRTSAPGASEGESALLDVDRAAYAGQTLYMMVVADDGAGNEAWSTLSTYKVPQAITAQTIEKSGSDWVVTTTFDASVTAPQLKWGSTKGMTSTPKTMTPASGTVFTATLPGSDVGGDPSSYFFGVSWNDGSGNIQTTKAMPFSRTMAALGVRSVVAQAAVTGGFQATITTTLPATLPSAYGDNLRAVEATWRVQGSGAAPSSVACATRLPLTMSYTNYTLDLGAATPLTNGTQYEVVLNGLLLDGTRVVLDTFTLTANGSTVTQRSVGWDVPVGASGQPVGSAQIVVVGGQQVGSSRQGNGRLLLDTAAPGGSPSKYEAVYGTLNTGRNHTMNVSFTGTGPYGATVSGSIPGDRTSVAAGSLRLGRRLAGSNAVFDVLAPTAMGCSYNSSTGAYSFGVPGLAALTTYEYKLYYQDTGTPSREVIVEWQPVATNAAATPFSGTSSFTVLAREQGQISVDADSAYSVTGQAYTGAVNSATLMQGLSGTVVNIGGTPGSSNVNGTVTGYFTSYSYDKLGRVIATNEGDGQYRRLDLDVAGNAVRTTSYGLGVDNSSYADHSSWARTSFKAYDDRGRVVAEFLAPNANGVRPVTRYQYDMYNNVTAKQTPEANSWNYSYTYNAAGTLLTATDPKGGVAKNYLDARGNVAASSTPRNTAIIAEIDLLTFNLDSSVVVGATSTATDYVKKNIYSADGLLLFASDEMGNTTGMTYDCQRRMISKTTALGVDLSTPNTPYLDFAGGRTSTPTRETTRNTTWFSYDARDRLVSMTTPHFIHVAYDNSQIYQDVRAAMSLPTTLATPLSAQRVRALKELATVRYSYDGRNNRIKTSVHTELKVNGGDVQLKEETSDLWTEQSYDAVGHVTDTVQKYAYDNGVNIGNLTEEKRHARMRYDIYGNLSWQTNGNGDSKKWTYAGFGVVDTFTDEDGWVTTYDDADSNNSYRRDGLVRRETGENEIQINGNFVTHKNLTRTYDNNGLLLSIVDNSDVGLFDVNGSTAYHQVSSTYTYTLDGKRLTENISAVERYKSSGVSSSEWVYTNHHRAITYTYDENRRLTKSADASNNNTVHYGEWATRASGVPINTAYDSNGNVISRYTDDNWKPTDGNDTRYLDSRYRYDRADRLRKETAADGTTVRDESTYDKAGNRTSRTVAGVLTDYTYDAANRLVKSVSGGLITRYGYDTRGNLTSTTVDTEVGVTVNEDTTPRLQTRKSEAVTNYDESGRPLITTSTTYTIEMRVNGGNGNFVHFVTGMTSRTDRSYDSAGNVRAVTSSAGSNNSVTQTYERFKDGRERSVAAAGRDQAGNSTSEYDANHHLTAVRGDVQHRRFVYDNEGHVLYADYDDYGSTPGGSAEYMYALGNSVGEMGMRDGVRTAVFDSQPVVDADNPRSYSLHNNSTPDQNGIVTLVTQSGDSCRSLARNYYRDESKWYLIAERNGLSGDSIPAGMLVTIGDWDRAGTPGSDAHAPTPTAGIYGSTSPNMHYTGAAPMSQCAMIAMIVIVVAVAVVAAVATAGIGGAIVGAVGASAATAATAGGVVVGGVVVGAATVATVSAGMVLATIGIYAAVGAVVYAAASMVRQGLEKGLFNYEEEGGFWHNVFVDGVVGGVSGAFIGAGEAIRLAEVASIAGKAGQAFEGGWSSVLSVGSLGRGALAAGSVISQTAVRNALHVGKDAAYSPVAVASAFIGATLNNAMDIESAYMSNMGKQINKGVEGLESAYDGASHAFSVLRTANAANNMLTPWASLTQSYLREEEHLDWGGAMAATIGEAASFVSTGSDQGQTVAKLYGLAVSVASGDPQTIGNGIGSFIGQGAVDLGRSLYAASQRTHSEFNVDDGKADAFDTWAEWDHQKGVDALRARENGPTTVSHIFDSSSTIFESGDSAAGYSAVADDSADFYADIAEEIDFAKEMGRHGMSGAGYDSLAAMKASYDATSTLYANAKKQVALETSAFIKKATTWVLPPTGDDGSLFSGEVKRVVGDPYQSKYDPSTLVSNDPSTLSRVSEYTPVPFDFHKYKDRGAPLPDGASAEEMLDIIRNRRIAHGMKYHAPVFEDTTGVGNMVGGYVQAKAGAALITYSLAAEVGTGGLSTIPSVLGALTGSAMVFGGLYNVATGSAVGASRIRDEVMSNGNSHTREDRLRWANDGNYLAAVMTPLGGLQAFKIGNSEPAHIWTPEEKESVVTMGEISSAFGAGLPAIYKAAAAGQLSKTAVSYLLPKASNWISGGISATWRQGTTHGTDFSEWDLKQMVVDTVRGAVTARWASTVVNNPNNRVIEKGAKFNWGKERTFDSGDEAIFQSVIKDGKFAFSKENIPVNWGKFLKVQAQIFPVVVVGGVGAALAMNSSPERSFYNSFMGSSFNGAASLGYSALLSSEFGLRNFTGGWDGGRFTAFKFVADRGMDYVRDKIVPPYDNGKKTGQEKHK